MLTTDSSNVRTYEVSDDGITLLVRYPARNIDLRVNLDVAP